MNESNVVIPSDVICDNLTNPNDCNLYFVAYVEPNAMRSFKISQTTAAQNLLKAQQINGYTVIPVSPSVHLNVHPDLINFQLVNNTVVIPFSLDYQYYQSYWNATDPSQPSGAYVFRPMQNYSLNYSGIVSGSYYLGTNIVEVHVKIPILKNILDHKKRCD